ncbi:hypothetical protein M231_04918 [Tremella mesenterica]|uniref:Uncharacterized protein n=1 Tax=Tremella mesenterica TaxID=5217 RepID=A0A4V1M3R9_TREME|nr:hypothetical protein M231_04917 [Tremella mesenterica]RXK37828.1 hypothetical protein M231_04918 [Tremella mesenterica]
MSRPLAQVTHFLSDAGWPNDYTQTDAHQANGEQETTNGTNLVKYISDESRMIRTIVIHLPFTPNTNNLQAPRICRQLQQSTEPIPALKGRQADR